MTPQQEVAFWRRSYQQLLNTHNTFANQVGTALAGNIGSGTALRTGGAQGTTPARRRNRTRARARVGGATGTLAAARAR